MRNIPFADEVVCELRPHSLPYHAAPAPWRWWIVPGTNCPPRLAHEYAMACAEGVVEYRHDTDTLEFGRPVELDGD